MKIKDTLHETYSALTANKVRSGLTVLGIVIGISSVIAMLAIGQGAQSSIQNSIQSIGSMFTPFFLDGGPVTDYASALKADKKAYGRFFHGMLKGGVYLPPAQWEAAFVSSAHTDRDLDFALSVARKALKFV